MTTGEDDLPVAVASALPLARSRVNVQTSQNSFIQTIDVAFIENRAVKLVLHVDVFPHSARRKAVSGTGYFHNRCALSIARRNKEPILINDDGLRNVDAHIRIPRLAPK